MPVLGLGNEHIWSNLVPFNPLRFCSKYCQRFIYSDFHQILENVNASKVTKNMIILVKSDTFYPRPDFRFCHRGKICVSKYCQRFIDSDFLSSKSLKTLLNASKLSTENIW